MITLKRTTSADLDFQNLIDFLDEDLKLRDGEEHSFYNQFNSIDEIRNVVVYYIESKPVGCGAFKKFDTKTAEIKRMFVHFDFRGKGIAAIILKELELWAAEIDYSEYILQTGIKQPEAIRLYEKSGYSMVPNYGQYENVVNSVCMKKTI